jgi:hypothetical protein
VAAWGTNPSQARPARTGAPAPAKAGGTLADLLGVMPTDLRRIEVALPKAAIQASFLDQAA